LTFFMLLIIPVVFFTALSFRRIARKVALNSNRVLARINALIQETMSGIFVAKSFRAEKAIYDEFDEMNLKSYNINLQRGIVFNSIFPILNILTGATTAAIIYLGGLEVLGAATILDFLPGRQLSYSEWFLFLQAINYFFFPIVQVASFWSQFQQGLAAAERVFSLMDAENTVVQTNNITPRKLEGRIEFKHLWFAYKEPQWILKDFNLLIPSGQNLAIVGHTGAGKSTLAKLIARFYEFQKGSLLIDDYNIRDLNLKEYRKQLAIISQEVFLFNDTLRNNILYGITDTEEAEQKMVEIFKQIDALDWIENLEDGFDTKVGERGNLLSQGQRQLIALVRTLLRDPAILIMDEATSSVDPFTELQIQKAANILMHDRTAIVIAHRLSTVKKADKIIVMKEGKIIETGTHQELIKMGGHYAELYDTYFRHQSLEYIESIAKQQR
ncbi:MAG: ABC transporter ATP-binding protein, partial [Methanobacteriota archaeon]